MSKPVDIAPATGKLGVLTPGMGAVATTLYAGVLAARKGLAQPYGSLTQIGHIAWVAATTPAHQDFVPVPHSATSLRLDLLNDACRAMKATCWSPIIRPSVTSYS